MGINKKTGKAILAVLLSLCLVSFYACGGGGGGGGAAATSSTASYSSSATVSPTSPDKKSWTYMVYLGADNNLSGMGLADLNEMETAGSDDKINIVVQAEFSTTYTQFDKAVADRAAYDGETLRFLVENDDNPGEPNIEAGTSIGNVDMGSPETLQDFIQWAVTNYPADHYALVIWDHGAGWKESDSAPGVFRGAVQDITSGSFMSLPQLAQAVSDAGQKIDVINFDACLMAMYEVAYEFKGLCDYMVFSEETEPGQGDPYDTILAALKDNHLMSPLTLAQTIVDKYIDYYESSGRSDNITKSAADMSALSSLDQKVAALSNAIVSEYDTHSAVILAAQDNSQNYYYAANHDLYDFCRYLDDHLAGGAIKSAAQDVMTAMSDVVAANRYIGASVDDSHGLAVYAPKNTQITLDEYNQYSQLACNLNRGHGWLDAVTTMIGGVPAAQTETGGFGFRIAWDTDADVDLYVIEPDNEWYAPWMGATSPNGFFSGDSRDTGQSQEYYLASDNVQAGTYYVVINYYEDSGASDQAQVTYFFIDPANGVPQWSEQGAKDMSLDNEAPEGAPLDELNPYSDWWYPGSLTREGGELTGFTFDAGDKTINVIFRHKKPSPGK